MSNYNQNRFNYGINNKYQNWNNNYNNNKNYSFNRQYNPNNPNNYPYNNNQNLYRRNYNPNYNSQANRQHNNNTKSFYNTLGYNFNGINIKEINLENDNKIETNQLMSIVSMPEYDHASPEELRLCDLEKFNTGKVTQFRINNTKNNNNIIKNKNNNNIPNNPTLFNNNPSIFNNNLSLFNNNQSLFNNNDSNKNKTLISGIDVNQRNNFFNTSNENNENPLINFNNPNQGKSLFDNKINFQIGENSGNTQFNQGSLFNEKTMLQDNAKNKKNEISLFNNDYLTNDKSLIINNPNPINNINNKSLFGEENKFDFSKMTFGNIDSNKISNPNLFKNEQPKIISSQDLYGTSKYSFPPVVKNTGPSLFDVAANNQINFLENNQNNINQNQNQDSLLNHDINTQKNKLKINISNNYNNNDNNNQFYTLNDIVNPLKNISFNNQIENEGIPETINKTIQNQKPINQFLEELEQKYENRGINENYENKDILDNYGTYQDYSGNYNRYYDDELPFGNNFNDNNLLNNYMPKDKIYNEGKSDNSKPKVSSLYEEYEKIKSQYLSKSNNNNKSYNKQNLITNNKNNNNYSNDTNKFNKNDNQNDILGRNNDLYQKNIMEMNKLINASINININLEDKKEKIENVNNNQNKNIVQIVKSNLPKEDDKKSSEKNQENIIIEKNQSYSVIQNNNYKENNNNKENELVPLELVPKLTKEGYGCSPSLVELGRKTKEELKKVEGFKIYNKYGEVEFKEPVNLLGVNLDDQINIEQNLIDTGDKLDYRSIFKLYNFKVKENELERYKNNLEKEGGNFIGYKNNEIVWEYNKN